jgi:hypothetical protein
MREDGDARRWISGDLERPRARGCDRLGALWMTREHSSERVGVEGFLGCRIFRALGTTVHRYFILYDLERPEVVGGPQYLARLNAPTPWSQRIMLRLRNFGRGGGRVVATAGMVKAARWRYCACKSNLNGMPMTCARRSRLSTASLPRVSWSPTWSSHRSRRAKRVCAAVTHRSPPCC